MLYFRVIEITYKGLTMDPDYNLQGVVRCHLCETAVPPLHCVFCHKNICYPCETKHVSDLSTCHKVVPFKERESNPICPKHTSEISDLYCKYCSIPICVQCASSKQHRHHKIVKGKAEFLKLD